MISRTRTNLLFGKPYFVYGLMLVMLAMPIYKYFVPVFLILTFLTWLIFEPKSYNKKLFLFSIPFLALYLNYILGMTYTENTNDGLANLETKLSFLIIPLFFMFLSSSLKKEIGFLLLTFILACIVNGFYGLVDGFIYYWRENDPAVFFSSYMSNYVHPTYYAVYLLSGIAAVYTHLLYPDAFNFPRYKKTSIALIVILSALVFFSASKGGLLALVLVKLLVILIYARRKKKLILLTSIFILTSVLVGFVMSKSVIVRTKFEYAWSAWNKSPEEILKTDAATTESSMVRIIIWDVAKQSILAHPFGVGTGDVQDELQQHYKAKQMLGAYEKQLNTHNQFFETTLAIGYSGLVLLVLCLIYTLVYGIRNKDLLLLSFFLIYVCNFMFESMLEAQAGVTHFVIFAVLLGYRVTTNTPKNN